MADKKVTELAAAGALDGSELVEAVQGGVNVQTTTADIAALAASGSGHVIEDEGTPLTQRANMNFVGGGVAVTDAGGKTVVTIAGGSAHVIEDEGTPLTQRTKLNFVGAGVTVTDDSGDDASVVTISSSTVGVHDFFIPASAMWPRVTGGCSLVTQFEMATSLFNVQALAFDQTTQEFAQFQVRLPRKWNNGTVTFAPYWTAQSGSGTVQWGLSGGAYSNDDALTVALGTPQTSDDTLLATNDLHIGPTSSAITLAGTPADADFLAFQISRNPASDTLSADALLLGIVIFLTTDAATDA